MLKKILIIGGGGHAKVVIATMRAMGGWSPQGILDPKLTVEQQVLGVRVLGGDELLLSKEWRDFSLAMGVGTMRATDVRKNLYLKYREMQYKFPVLQHPSVTLADKVVIRDGTQLMAGVIVQSEASIGANCIVNTGAIVEHDCHIADHCHIAPGAVLGGHVTVGECSLIGLGARVLPGIKIGRHVTVGAGAMVLRDIPEGVTAMGAPAKIL